MSGLAQRTHAVECFPSLPHYLLRSYPPNLKGSKQALSDDSLVSTRPG